MPSNGERGERRSNYGKHILRLLQVVETYPSRTPLLIKRKMIIYIVVNYMDLKNLKNHELQGIHPQQHYKHLGPFG